jgi:hypothetical protein
MSRTTCLLRLRVIAIVAAGVVSASCGKTPTTVAGDISSGSSGDNADVMVQMLQIGIATRALAIEDPAAIQSKLESMPLGIIQHNHRSDLQSRRLWSLFFSGSLTKMAGRKPNLSALVFYNPLTDVAVLQRCLSTKTGEALSCKSLCALPGEVLTNDPVARGPHWLESANPLADISRITSLRMTALERVEVGDMGQRLCKPGYQAQAELRLLDQIAVMGAIDAKQLKHAVALYIADHIAVDSHDNKKRIENDVALATLLLPGEVSLSGVANLGDAGFLLFYTPKRNGWQQAVLYVHKDVHGQIDIRGARVLRYKS